MAAVTPELDGKMRQFKRVLLSYADFKHAKLASAYILIRSFMRHTRNRAIPFSRPSTAR